MRNTIRVRKDGATKPASVQTKTSRRVSRQESKPAKKPVSLIFWQEDELVESSGIDLADAEFAAIQKDATARGESLAAWLFRTIEESAALRTLKLEVAS